MKSVAKTDMSTHVTPTVSCVCVYNTKPMSCLPDPRRQAGVGVPQEEPTNSQPVRGQLRTGAVICGDPRPLHIRLREGK